MPEHEPPYLAESVYDELRWMRRRVAQLQAQLERCTAINADLNAKLAEAEVVIKHRYAKFPG